MALIAELLGQNPDIQVDNSSDEIPKGANFGFEVELENLGGGLLSWPRVAGWEIKGDGSLRDGVEYVFSGPQSGLRALASLNSFEEAMRRASPTPTFRCSTHLHLDVRDLTMDQLKKLVLTYMAFEDVFFDHCQETRRHSNFCIPFMNNDYLSTFFGRRILSLDREDLLMERVVGWSKYSALNLQTVARFGTVEFRGSHAMTSKDEMIPLMARMVALKDHAKASTEVSIEDFVANLASGIPLSDIFPDTALRPGYTLDIPGKAMGISSVLNSLLQAESARTGLDPFRDEWERRAREERQRAREIERENSRIRSILLSEVIYNAQFLRSISIQAPTTAQNIGGALRMLDSLSHVNGLDVSLRNITTGMSNVMLQLLRDYQESGALASNGFNISLNQLR